MSDLPLLSVALAPTLDTPELAAYAEELGFHRVWLYDTPALQLDVWIALALSAQRTSTIGLGTAVLVPNLRHVLVTASAIAHMEGLAPGRCAYAFGTGFTARMALGQKALSWKYLSKYVTDLRALLNGEAVEVDGAKVAMLHGEGQAPARPISVPLILAASGPKGIAIAKEIGDGVFGVGPIPGFDVSPMLMYGAVLDEGEPHDSPRVLDATGASAAVAYHGVYEAAGEGVDNLPGGAVWREAIEQVPADVRHLEVHRGHMTAMNEFDKLVMNGPLAVALSGSGDAEHMRGRLRQMKEGGATEVAWLPVGSDPKRELRAFMDAAKG